MPIVTKTGAHQSWEAFSKPEEIIFLTWDFIIPDCRDILFAVILFHYMIEVDNLVN